MKKTIFTLYILHFTFFALAQTNDPFGWMGVGVAPRENIDLVAEAVVLPPHDFQAVVTNTPGFTPLSGPGLAPAEVDLGLEATVPAQDFARVKELARGLDYDWERCFEFVRDHIAFTPAWGLARGPERTLLEREGNDVDQAFLLLALLQVSGHDADVCYTQNGPALFCAPVSDHDGATPCNAADWLGVSTEGTESEIYARVEALLQAAGRYAAPVVVNGANHVATDHFWVELREGNVTHRLDPSFKPRARTPSRDVLADAGYGRAALIASAAGSVNAAGSVQNLSAAGLESHLNALAAGLRGAWTNDVPATAYVGETRAAPWAQGDVSRFPGHVSSDAYNAWSAQNNGTRNAFRVSMTLTHGAMQKMLYLDEIGARCLWISYVASGANRRAVLSLEDDELASEPAGAVDGGTVGMTLNIKYYLNQMPATYTLKRDVSHVYAIPIGFGGDAPHGMRAWVAGELAKLRAQGVANNDRRVVARSLQNAGHQWLSQVSMLARAYNHVNGRDYRHFYNVGIAAQESAPYVDMKNALYYTTQPPTHLDNGTMFFASAL
ncbi:MAG: hypothetical protein FWF96_04300, partial [Kiritimatiellaeota bacterium]|nr:hypothetical protein [Kiritimatiellota bacterium]